MNAEEGLGPGLQSSIADDLPRRMVESATECALIASDIAGQVTYWNIGAERLFGFAAGDILGRSLRVIMTQQDRASGLLLDEMAEAQATGRALVERWQVRRDGTFFWATGLMLPLLPGGGFITIVRDLTERKLADDRVRADEARFRTLVEGVPQLLWRSCDKGDWTWASPQWCAFTGLSVRESQGRGWLDAVHPDDRKPTMAAWDAARAHGMLDVEFRVRRASDGAYLWHRTRSTPVRNEDGNIIEWLGTTTDVQHLKDHADKLEAEVRERERAEARLLYIVFHDHLTELHNRAYFMDRLKLALEHQARTAGMNLFVVFMDLDGFKLVNDSLGHVVGDRLLVDVARRLQDCMRPQDTLARLGGDEFAVLVQGGNGETGAAIAAEIVETMRRPFWLEQRRIYTSGSIGMVKVTDRHSLAEDVLRDADIAMYQAKRRNAGGYEVFEESMRDAAVEALELRTELQNAVQNQEFVLHYQPICSVETRTILGVEALIRWKRPRRGLVMPGDFIGTAEETGLIRPIGRWVLREACRQVRSWQEQFPGADLRVSVNASGEELKDPEFLSDVRETLRITRLDPRALQLEVTESVFLQKAEGIGRKLQDIRELGVRIALDDFGTGYSSLSYLDSYEIDTVKIDHSFVDRMVSNPKTRVIVQTIVTLGKDMGLDMVAEGVQSDEQLDLLRLFGCGLVQGHLLCRPGPADDVGLLLGRRSLMDR